jgi:hypothetical protein
MFNNLPRAGDAERFLAMLSAEGGQHAAEELTLRNVP